MSHSKKKTSEPLVEKRGGVKAPSRDKKSRRAAVFTISAVLVIILIAVVVGILVSSAPFRINVVVVDDEVIRMDYFLKRVELSGEDQFEMLGLLATELLVKIEASKYVGEVTEAEIDDMLRAVAQGDSETISESEFNEWFRQRLNETGFTRDEYRGIARITLLTVRLHEYLAERVPTVAEQVHLRAIAVSTYEETEEVLSRLEDGEDFADLARELTLDEESRESGGDIGWFPRGVMGASRMGASWVDDILFNLEIDGISEPLAFEDAFYIFKLIDRTSLREISEEHLWVLKSNVLSDWISQEIGAHNVEYHGLHNGFDNETAAWVSLQLARRD